MYTLITRQWAALIVDFKMWDVPELTRPRPICYNESDKEESINSSISVSVAAWKITRPERHARTAAVLGDIIIVYPLYVYPIFSHLLSVKKYGENW